MTPAELLTTFQECRQCEHRKGQFYPCENWGPLARKLRPYQDAAVEQVAPGVVKLTSGKAVLFLEVR